MKDVLIILFSFATLVGLFYLRVRQSDAKKQNSITFQRQEER